MGVQPFQFLSLCLQLKKNALVVEKSIFVNETGLSKLDLSVSRICSNVTNLFASASYYVNVVHRIQLVLAS